MSRQRTLFAQTQHKKAIGLEKGHLVAQFCVCCEGNLTNKWHGLWKALQFLFLFPSWILYHLCIIVLYVCMCVWSVRGAGFVLWSWKQRCLFSFNLNLLSFSLYYVYEHQHQACLMHPTVTKWHFYSSREARCHTLSRKIYFVLVLWTV